jgi:hypothetical protein
MEIFLCSLQLDEGGPVLGVLMAVRGPPGRPMGMAPS